MATELERFFYLAWDTFLEGDGLDGECLGDTIEKAGLASWQPATEADCERCEFDIEVGDPVMKLTDAGRAALKAAHENK